MGIKKASTGHKEGKKRERKQETTRETMREKKREKERERGGEGEGMSPTRVGLLSRSLGLMQREKSLEGGEGRLLLLGLLSLPLGLRIL